MYNEDDAVAKLDGYVVSVFGAAPLVGEKTLVRIEKVGRSAAQASLVNPPEGISAAAASGSASTPASADGSNGRRRRRGRRGGRGRRKKAETGTGSSSS
jgi:ribonuclease G